MGWPTYINDIPATSYLGNGKSPGNEKEMTDAPRCCLQQVNSLLLSEFIVFTHQAKCTQWPRVWVPTVLVIGCLLSHMHARSAGCISNNDRALGGFVETLPLPALQHCSYAIAMWLYGHGMSEALTVGWSPR